jgi:hypothetical protein
MPKTKFTNPFRPGAGHQPPYLAGRKIETDEFSRLLRQEVVLENLVLTGLRGVGKTVLLESFKPLALKQGWLWVGTDLSESVSLSEERLAIRLMSDLGAAASHISVGKPSLKLVGFHSRRVEARLDFPLLTGIFGRTPGLIADKLRAVLEFVWSCLVEHNVPGLVFAYDEAQNMSDHAERNEFPLSLMLDAFQSIQKRDVRFLLALAGLPNLFPQLVEARTYSERMFRVLVIDRLSPVESRQAILRPIDDARCPVKFSEQGISTISEASGGYPYLIQFICREAYDSYLAQYEASLEPQVYINDIVTKLDSDFYAGRWARVTDRQRELLLAAAEAEDENHEFTLQQVSAASKRVLKKGFSTSQISQMFNRLGEAGLIYKNRHGRHAFAVPLLGAFVRRHRNEIAA